MESLDLKYARNLDDLQIKSLLTTSQLD